MDLAIPLDFHGAQPRHFGAPAASAQPLELAGFTGAVAHGASCNCEVITLIPHCNGTHTECVGHLTRERLDAYRVVPAGLIPALLLSVTAAGRRRAGESTDPAPAADDLLITRRALEQRLAGRAPFDRARAGRAHAAQPADQAHRDYTGQATPYLSREAAQLSGRARHRAPGGRPALDRP